MTTINKDLQREREKCTFNSLELTHFLDGNAEKTAQRRERENFFLSDPELKEPDVPVMYKSHKEAYEDAMRRSCLLIKKIQQLQMQNQADMDTYSQVIGGSLGGAILKGGNPLTLHYVMFLPTLMGQGTIRQQSEWVSKAFNCSIIGTYAQTELGHGTFIRGLETTATYDPTTLEFVLNSPTLTSYKWWPGGLGHTANYAIVVAQLYTKGECKGIHPFIVQLRDEETHEPMPGIKIGEIGVKLGMNTTNNGYLGFNNVRIPREHMLMKNSQVLEDGTYVKAPSSKLTYGTMMFVRVVLVREMAMYLAKAVTIGVRYSAVRRQSQIRPDEPESQIIDYVTQQYKLFPNIAACYAILISANWIWMMYNHVSTELDQGSLERLPELHAAACCLKAVVTSDVAAAIEQIRLACGGHGYMASSSFPTIYGLATAACTYEGENTVLFLQTARYLVKACREGMKGKILPPTVQYLSITENGDKSNNNKSWNTLDDIVDAYQAVAAGKIRLATNNLDRRIESGRASEDAWNDTSIELAQAAESHCRAFMVSRFVDTVKSLSVSKESHQVVLQLCELYVVHWVLQRLGDFLRFSWLDSRDVPLLQKRLEEMLAAIRPNAVSLVDSFDIRDEILDSSLGAYDGNVYERLYAEAMKSPLNHQPVNESFQLYLKPFIKSQM